MSSSNTKVTVNLPDVVVQELKELAKANNVTMTDLIAQSIRLNKFLSDREREGGIQFLAGGDHRTPRRAGPRGRQTAARNLRREGKPAGRGGSGRADEALTGPAKPSNVALR